MKVLDEKELWLRWRERGDETARNDLILRHTRIVRYIAGRMAVHVPSNIEMNDLVGWGMLGLVDAVDKFDHKQDIKFSTYASIRIRGAILDQIRSLDWAPRSLRAMGRRIGAARDRLRQEHGREPFIDDIAAEVGATAEQVEDAVAQLQTAQVMSLQDYLPAEDSEQARKLDITIDPRALSPDAHILDQERQAKLVQAILSLPDQQQKVLNLYYYEELTLKEIGAVLEVSESRICQIHSAAIKTLRKAVQRGD